MAVLRAVSHAHAHGVVHRDLKPSNILVTNAESHVKLLDFGIAKVLDPGDPRNDVEPTGPGRRPMTPGFASPEQILGLPITAASDIYQLGLLLHELLTGTRPFDDCSPRDYERSVTTTLPDPPSRVLLLHSGAVTMSGVADRRALSRILKGDLDAIVLHCLHRDPAARYESVDALHEDIARYLEGRPVAARRATATYRLEKLLRRRAHRLVLRLVPVLAIAASWLVLDRSSDAGATATSVSTSSPQAYRLYIEGLAAYRTGDNRIADRFFHAALEEDSMFALAASYASRAIYDENPQAGRQLLNRAYRLADHASDRERLVIRARWASAMEDPLLGAFADSLVRLFPAEPEGQYLLGLDRFHAGRFLEAVGHLEHAVALDSLSLHATRAPCVACDALARTAFSYVLADSMAAAVRVSERWTRLQPGSALAWQELAASLLRAGRYDEAIEARGRAATLRVGDALDAIFPGVVAIHRGDFEEADRLFRLHLGTGTPTMRIEAAHWLAISLRTQGRWNAALEAAEALLDASRLVSQDYSWDILGQIHRAAALLGSGRPDEAARVFEASVRSNEELSVSRLSRDHAWYLTQAGTAWAAAGDTARLAALADRVETVGARSIYGRDQRLHHHLRALLAGTRRATESEREGHLRDALFSLPFGYSRINLELAESLLRQQRHEDAAAVAGAALRNSIQSNGMYATRTDFHEQLGRIWHAAGEADSAAVHIRAALHGWRAADPILQPRVAQLESLLASLEQEGAAPR
jgi:tetratricopeptide (TPR) repeat protein